MTTAVILAILALYTVGPTSSVQPHTVDPAAIDAEARRLMKREDVQGLAVAVVDRGKVEYVAAYGWRNAERKLALTTDTIMYGASLTKTAVAYMVLQLVDEGRLGLDRSIAELLPRPLPEYEEFTDLSRDERWRALTPRILLTHTTGFANFRWLEPDKRLQFHSNPGVRYGYSGEGFYILQLVIEQHLGVDVGAEMQTRVFGRLGMTNTSMTWRPVFAKNLADGYKVDGAMTPHDERSSVSAAGSMDTSIADQARLWAGIMRGDGLSAASRAELVRPQVPIGSSHQFPTLETDLEPKNEEIALAAGLGLVTFRDTSGPAWFKGGHNDSTGNLVICLENEKRCAVMLSNDVRAERIFPELTRKILGETKMPTDYQSRSAPQVVDR